MNTLDYFTSLLVNEDKNESPNLLLLHALGLGNELIKSRTDQQINWYQILNRAGILRKLPNGHLSNQYVISYMQTPLGKNLQSVLERDIAILKANSNRIKSSAIVHEDKYYKPGATLIS